MQRVEHRDGRAETPNGNSSYQEDSNTFGAGGMGGMALLASRMGATWRKLRPWAARGWGGGGERPLLEMLRKAEREGQKECGLPSAPQPPRRSCPCVKGKGAWDLRFSAAQHGAESEGANRQMMDTLWSKSQFKFYCVCLWLWTPEHPCVPAEPCGLPRKFLTKDWG